MTKPFLAMTTALWLTAGLWAQQTPKQPAPKSQKEVEALMAIQNPPECAPPSPLPECPDARIKAADDLVHNFKDTEFKEFAYQMKTLSYQQKNEYEAMLVAGEQTLEINPDNIVVLITLAQAIPQRTKEFDLDKEEKLQKAEKLAKKAQTLVPNLAKFNPQITDEEWAGYKKSAMSQVHEALGMAAFVRKNYPAAEQAFKASVDVSPQPDPTTLYRLAMVYNAQNKYDEAIAALDKAIAAGGLKVGDKDLAAEQKAAIMKAKESASKPAAPPASAPAPQVEIKRP